MARAWAGPGLLLVLLLCGCVRSWEPLPTQHAAPTAKDPEARPCFAATAEPRAKGLFRGVLFGSETQSWTLDDVEFTCTLPEGGAWDAVLQFEVASATIDKTGPVTLEMTLEGARLEGLRCTRAGRYEWRAAVPAELAQAGRALTLQTKIGPPFVAEGDSARLGVLLSAGGYLRR